ncbi:MAG: hypothetical protein JWP59_4416 [Massilia sp.]|nr:hypothetical protein [Massilia sp.]
MNLCFRLLPAAVALAVSAAAGAAPLDALLTANHFQRAGAGEVELAYDTLNSSLDFLGLREKDSAATTSAVGDYKGGHVRAGIAATPRLWIDGAYWKRNIDYRSFDAKLDSWQVAGQYKFLDADGRRPAMALRLGGWGNNADSLTKYTNTTVAGTKFTSATVNKPRDKQLQLDLIGTWTPSTETALSVFGGVGQSRVEFDSVSATSRTSNGCNYNVAFSPAGVEATLASPCTAKVVIDRFTQAAGATVDVYKEARYKSTFAQLGVTGEWHSGNWRARLGYQYQSIKRDDVDDIIENRGGTAYKHSHVLVTDVSYNIYKNVVLFARGQLMSNQFNGEVPLAYNSLTAEKYDQKYGFISTGLSLVF